MHAKSVRRGFVVAASLIAAVWFLPQPVKAGESSDTRLAQLHRPTIVFDPFVGWYAVEGTTPGGKTYSGIVAIVRKGDRYKVIWKIGARLYRGLGKTRSGRLVVDWGKDKPAIYVPADDGSLQGTWAGGRGREELRPARQRLEG